VFTGGFVVGWLMQWETSKRLLTKTCGEKGRAAENNGRRKMIKDVALNKNA